MSSSRSPETKEPNVEFDISLLEETENLQANEILWNNLTADSLQAMWVEHVWREESIALINLISFSDVLKRWEEGARNQAVQHLLLTGWLIVSKVRYTLIHCISFRRLKSTSDELGLTQQSLRTKEDLMQDLENKLDESTKTCEKKSEYVATITIQL